MPYADDPEKWHYLSALYSEKSNTELLDLHAVYDDLTEDAQSILRTELTRRKLWANGHLLESTFEEPVSEPEEIDPQDGTEIDSDSETYSDYELLQMGGVTLAECETTKQAELICFTLDQEEIKNAIRQRHDRGDLRWPQVLVAPDDLERSQTILDKGISPELREEFESLPVEVDFQNPACPQCGSLDALLESVDPMNRWLCGDCGAQWQDARPES